MHKKKASCYCCCCCCNANFIRTRTRKGTIKGERASASCFVFRYACFISFDTTRRPISLLVIIRFRYETLLRKSYVKIQLRLDVQLGSSPVSSLRVVTNGVTSLHANPLRNRAVLLLLFAQDFLDFKGLLRWLFFHNDAEKRERPFE